MGFSSIQPQPLAFQGGTQTKQPPRHHEKEPPVDVPLQQTPTKATLTQTTRQTTDSFAGLQQLADQQALLYSTSRISEKKPLSRTQTHLLGITLAFVASLGAILTTSWLPQSKITLVNGQTLVRQFPRGMTSGERALLSNYLGVSAHQNGNISETTKRDVKMVAQNAEIVTERLADILLDPLFPAGQSVITIYDKEFDTDLGTIYKDENGNLKALPHDISKDSLQKLGKKVDTYVRIVFRWDPNTGELTGGPLWREGDLSKNPNQGDKILDKLQIFNQGLPWPENRDTPLPSPQDGVIHEQ